MLNVDVNFPYNLFIFSIFMRISELLGCLLVSCKAKLLVCISEAIYWQQLSAGLSVRTGQDRMDILLSSLVFCMFVVFFCLLVLGSSSSSPLVSPHMPGILRAETPGLSQRSSSTPWWTPGSGRQPLTVSWRLRRRQGVVGGLIRS